MAEIYQFAKLLFAKYFKYLAIRQTFPLYGMLQKFYICGIMLRCLQWADTYLVVRGEKHYHT